MPFPEITGRVAPRNATSALPVGCSIALASRQGFVGANSTTIVITEVSTFGQAFLTGDPTKNPNYLQVDIDAINKTFTDASNKADGHLPLATVTTVADALANAESTKDLATRSIAAAQKLRAAHAALAENVKVKATLAEAIAEVTSLAEEVKAAKALKKKIDDA